MMIKELTSLNTSISEQYDNFKFSTEMIIKVQEPINIPSGCLSIDYIFEFGEIDKVPLVRVEDRDRDEYVFLANFYINKNEFPYFVETHDQDQFVCNYHFHFNRDYISDGYDFGEDVSNSDVSLFVTEFEQLQDSNVFNYTNSQIVSDYHGEINFSDSLDWIGSGSIIYYNCMNYEHLSPLHNVDHIASFEAEPNLHFSIRNINYQISYVNLVSQESKTIEYQDKNIYNDLDHFSLDLDFNTLYNYETGDFIIKDDGINGFYSPWKTKVDYLITFDISAKGASRKITLKHKINYTDDLWGEAGLYKFYSVSKNFKQIDSFKEA